MKIKQKKVINLFNIKLIRSKVNVHEKRHRNKYKIKRLLFSLFNIKLMLTTLDKAFPLTEHDLWDTTTVYEYL